MKKSPRALIAPCLELVLGVGAIVLYILLSRHNWELRKWVVVLIFPFVFSIFGIWGIFGYIQDRLKPPPPRDEE